MKPAAEKRYRDMPVADPAAGSRGAALSETAAVALMETSLMAATGAHARRRVVSGPGGADGNAAQGVAPGLVVSGLVDVARRRRLWRCPRPVRFFIGHVRRRGRRVAERVGGAGR